jgi:hypothetical protein
VNWIVWIHKTFWRFCIRSVLDPRGEDASDRSMGDVCHDKAAFEGGVVADHQKPEYDISGLDGIGLRVIMEGKKSLGDRPE